MDEGNPSATKTTLIVAQECSTALLGNAFVLYRRPRVQHGSLGQHFRTFSSPEGTARHAWATLSYIFVARGCSAARLGNAFVLYRRPRVQHGTLERHFRTSSSPKGAGQNDVWMKGTLRRRKPHLSSPEGAARHAWATLSHFFVARGCSTARLSDTFVHLRRPRVQHGTLERHLRAFPRFRGKSMCLGIYFL